MPKRRKSVDWIHKLTTKSRTNLPEGALSEGKSSQEMASALRRSAPDFQAAMALLTVHANTMGKRLTRSHAREMEKAKHILREMFKRQDRIEDYEIPKKKGKLKWLRNRAAALHVQFKDENNQPGYGDMFAELLGKTPQQLEKLVGISAYHKNMLPYLSVWESFLREYYKTQNFDDIRKKLFEQWHNAENDEVPVWDVKNKRPRVVNKEASVMEEKLVFASKSDAVQYLSDSVGKRIKIAVQKTTEIKEKRLRVDQIDIALAQKIGESVAKIEKLKEQATKAEEVLRQTAGTVLDLQEKIDVNLKEHLKSLNKMMEAFRDSAEDAQTVILEIGNTEVVLEEYVSQRPSFQAAFNLLKSQVEEQLKQSITRALEASYEVKQKAAQIVKKEKTASFLSEWWNKILGWIKEISQWISRTNETIQKLRDLKNSLAMGQVALA
jgi:hypothetical protein